MKVFLFSLNTVGFKNVLSVSKFTEAINGMLRMEYSLVVLIYSLSFTAKLIYARNASLFAKGPDSLPYSVRP